MKKQFIICMGMMLLLLTGCKQDNVADTKFEVAAKSQEDMVVKENASAYKENGNKYELEEKEKLNTRYKIENEASAYWELENTIDHINELTQ